jgi:ABC-type multidrug transport system fused ATPase/permease subunit
MNGAGPAIEARGICKSFGTTRALADVDLVADSGRVFALLGPNGAGKTTLVRILTTLLRPDAGTARVAGLDVADDAAGVRRVIGLTGQFAAVDSLLTGRENLEMVGELCQLPRRAASRRAAGLLERLGLAEAADRKQPFELDIDDLDAPLIGAFLSYLERDRGNSPRTRNARLGALPTRPGRAIRWWHLNCLVHGGYGTVPRCTTHRIGCPVTAAMRS